MIPEPSTPRTTIPEAATAEAQAIRTDGSIPDPSRWAAVRRLLAIRLDAMGDVLMTTPALRAVRASLPDVHLTLLTSPAAGSVARRVPEVDEVIEFRAPWMKAPSETGAMDAVPALVEELRRGGYDAAIVFTVFSQSPLPAAMACRMAGIPRVLAHVRENPYALVSDWVRDTEWPVPTRHEVRRQLDLVAAVGFATDDEHLSYRVDPAASRRVRDRLRQAGIDRQTPFVVLHPGASAASRRYRWQGFAAAARRLAAEDGLRILITGSPDERALTACVAAEVPGALDLAGSLDSDELAALIAIAPVLTTNNTGPAHLAAALGTPVVVLYAQTNLQHTPWLVPSRVITRDVPCRNCLKSVCPLGHHACLAPVTPEEIVAATREMLATGDRAARQALTAESLSRNSQESAWNTTLRSTSAANSPPECPAIDVTHSATVVSAGGPRAMSSASAARRARTR